MIKVIRYALFSLFYYCEKPVMDRLGRHRQNGHFMVVIRTQFRYSRSQPGDEYSHQGEIIGVNPDHHASQIIKIPIVHWHTSSPCLRPAVSSLGACPTPAP